MKPIKVNLNPLSVNKCWMGRRFKTQEYKAYEKSLLLLLPNNVEIPLGSLKLTLKWGFSSKLADWDNPIKPFQDILQKKYNFDDKRVFECFTSKEIVKKGEEFVEFKIEKL